MRGGGRCEDGARARGPAASRAHALLRDGFTCQLCGGRRNLEVHHIRFRSRGGVDSGTNLLTLCRTCHLAVHSGHVRLDPPRNPGST